MSEDGGFGVAASLQVQIGNLASAISDMSAGMERDRRDAQRLMQAVHQVPIGPGLIPITGGAGQFTQDPAMGPNTGYFWSVRRLTVWGFSAGTVSVFLNSLNGEQLPSFPSQGTYTFGRGEVMLQPNDNLFFSATGITVASGFAGVQIAGIADNGELWVQPRYLV